MLLYLLGALCGLFGEVVVGVVSLCDATEQHSHNACGTYKNMQTHLGARTKSALHWAGCTI